MYSFVATHALFKTENSFDVVNFEDNLHLHHGVLSSFEMSTITDEHIESMCLVYSGKKSI